MKNIKVPYNGRGYQFSYFTETIDLGLESLDFVNVHVVKVTDEDLKDILGEMFTILQHPLQLTKPVFALNSSSIEEQNLKKLVAQQIINNPTE